MSQGGQGFQNSGFGLKPYNGGPASGVSMPGMGYGMPGERTGSPPTMNPWQPNYNPPPPPPPIMQQQPQFNPNMQTGGGSPFENPTYQPPPQTGGGSPLEHFQTLPMQIPSIPTGGGNPMNGNGSGFFPQQQPLRSLLPRRQRGY